MNRDDLNTPGKFLIRIRDTDIYQIEIEAKDLVEAAEIALEIMKNSPEKLIFDGKIGMDISNIQKVKQ